MMRSALKLFSISILVILVLPSLVIVPLSFTAGNQLILPMPGVSLQWYREFLSSENWRDALQNSLVLALLSTALAAPLGTLAALGLMRAPAVLQRVLMGIMMLPLIVPPIIFAVSAYFLWARLGLVNSLAGMVLGHLLISVPFVMMTVSAGLRRFDFGLMRAAASLGASPFQCHKVIFVPLMAPAILGGSILAFAISFDDVVVALLLSGPDTRTLPRQLFSNVRDSLTPAVAVAAVLMTFISVAVMALQEFLSVRNNKAGQVEVR